MKSSRTIKVDTLARVEGDGALYVKIKNGNVEDVKFKIWEPPRLFEAFLRGRNYSEAPDITARICGICPIAYQMSSAHAMETGLGVKVDPQVRALRRLIYCGEWIESHALHVFLLHAPDFLGYEDAIQMAADHPEIVEQALQLKKVGNDVMTFLGGREIHPINICVGGFYKVPPKKDLLPFVEKLKWARDVSLEAVRWTAKLPFPDFDQDYEFVALRHPDEYGITEGRLASNKGLDIAISEFGDHFEEEHVTYTNALHCRHKEHGAYFVGPLARYNVNFDKLPPIAQQAARDAGLGPVCLNPFKSIIVRMVETVFACDEAIRLIEQYEMPDKPRVEIKPRAVTGHGCTEAPRGLLYHRYRLDAQGVIEDAWIVPPTAQNQKSVESDLWRYVRNYIDLPNDKLQWQCEQAIRNYDPCISCATHFLKLHIERE